MKTIYGKTLVKDMLKSYKQCLNAEYTHTAKDVSFTHKFNKDHSKLTIFFEWSNGKTDWINNFRFKAKPYKEMDISWKCHGGFLECWNDAKDILKPYIMDERVKSIKIVGYSHGAALALLCHEYCVFRRPDISDNIIGYGFGCPRVIHGWFTCKCIRNRWKNFYVIRNHNDIVTHVPPVLFGFIHVGNILKIGKKAKWNPVDSHRPQNYIESLENLIKEMNDVD